MASPTVLAALSHNSGPKPSFPQLKLPTFDRDPLEWATFWDLFQTMISREKHRTDAEKLYYLRASINSKEGQRIVSAISTNGGDYSKAVEEL